MNKKIFIFVLVFFVLFSFLVEIFAQTNPSSGDTNVVTGNEVQIPPGRPPGEFIINVYIFFLTISGFLAFFVIIWGGFQRVINAGNPEKIRDADEWIKSALLGILLLFGAWLLLNTINPSLLQLDLPELQKLVIPTPPPLIPSSGGGGGDISGLSEEEARKKLRENQIEVNADPPQTELKGIRPETIDEIIRFKKECEAYVKATYSNSSICRVVVTGGTERTPHNFGECSHQKGYKIDISKRNANVNDFITRKYCCKNEQWYTGCGPCGRRSDGAWIYKSPTGAIYAEEGNHWDIVVGC